MDDLTTLRRRLEKLEMWKKKYGRRLAGLVTMKKTWLTMYHRYYRTAIRSKNSQRQWLRVVRMANRMEKSMAGWGKLGAVAGSIERGRHIATFTNQERLLLRDILKRRIPYAPRKSRQPNWLCQADGHTWASRAECPPCCPRCHSKRIVPFRPL